MKAILILITLAVIIVILYIRSWRANRKAALKQCIQISDMLNSNTNLGRADALKLFDQIRRIVYEFSLTSADDPACSLEHQAEVAYKQISRFLHRYKKCQWEYRQKLRQTEDYDGQAFVSERDPIIQMLGYERATYNTFAHEANIFHEKWLKAKLSKTI